MRRDRRANLAEFLREIGALWVAFAPLDSALAPDEPRWGLVILFLLGGLGVFLVGLLIDEG